MSMPIAASGVWADMSVPIPSLGFDDIKVVESPVTPAKKGKKSSTKACTRTPVSLNVQEAVMTAKVNADIGNDIRWDIIMQEISEVAPAPPCYVTPVVKTFLPMQLCKDADESTSAGETNESDFGSSSECGSPARVLRPPPGLSGPPGLAPPGLSAPPGLGGPPGLAAPPGLSSLPGLEDDCPPPPGFEASGPVKKSPPWRRATKAGRA
eukprot:gnl/MRDRNA2_/MRDRNA2_93496_c0_seq1.p1 gnl/MRDRNA2_/MRDRNA2_93496_c0~~gnl/MRDRNA2_/MRDRNA2_93496_c0_seq1.p1  ORF type:complete len:209 (-),score=48.08 gnl/MRDRNA2_/MRDRNA2_93496_c0_seq1:116-742(-)